MTKDEYKKFAAKNLNRINGFPIYTNKDWSRLRIHLEQFIKNMDELTHVYESENNENE